MAFHTEVSLTPINYNGDSDKFENNENVVETETYLKATEKWTPNFNTFIRAGVTTSDDTKVHTSNFGTQGYAALGSSYSM